MVTLHPRLGTEVLKIEPFGFDIKVFHLFNIDSGNFASKRLNHPLGRDNAAPIYRLIPCTNR